MASEAHALAQLRPGVDGVVFEYGHYRSTFLPQVWEQLPEPAEFLAHLKRKAGLPMDFWAEDVKLSRYTVSKWKECRMSNELARANDREYGRHRRAVLALHLNTGRGAA